MIKEAFLICALTIPPTFSGKTPEYTFGQVFQFLMHVIHKEYSDDYKSKNPIILLIDDSPTLVDRLRAMDVVAFAMSPFSPMSRWQFYGDYFWSPIKDQSVSIVFLQNPVRRWHDVSRTMSMVKNSGYLILNMKRSLHFDLWITGYGWEKLPFQMDNHTIYRKRIQESA